VRRKPRQPPIRLSLPDRRISLIAAARFRPTTCCAFIFLLALVVRVLHQWSMQHTPFSQFLLGDAERYDAWAQGIANGDWLGTGVFYQAPLYPYTLAALYSVFGHSLTLVRAVQALWGSLACVFVCLAAYRFFGPLAGVAGGVILALYGPAVFFDYLIQKSSLDGFLVSSVVCLAVYLAPHRRLYQALGLGLLLGLLSLNRENALVLIPLMAVWVASATRRVLAMSALLLGVAVALAPVLIRNRIVGGEWVLTSSQSGTNLFIGNNADATGTYVPLIPSHGNVAFEERDARQIAERDMGTTLRSSGVSAYWRTRAFRWVRENPKDAVLLALSKLALLLNAREAADSEDIDSHAEVSWPLRVCASIDNFGVIAPLAAVGIWVTRRRWRQIWLLYVLLAEYAGSVLVFFVLDRYRYPLVPFVSIFAAAGVAVAVDAWPRGRRRELAPALLVLMTTAVLCNWPLRALRSERLRAVTAFNVGNALETAGRSTEAIEQYRDSIRFLPSFAPAHGNLGALLARTDSVDEGIKELDEAIRLDPHLAEARTNLGATLAAVGRLDEAIVQLEKAVSLESENAESHYNLATALASSGEFEAARREYELTLRIAPNRADAHNNLGSVLASQGQIDAAIAHFREGLRLQPDLTGAKANLERAQSLRRPR
jgi:Tfp pilus assembly protein PilF/4-amino-4-deoxy-L-arabinose transferase-like glycosyltransferase